MWKLILLFIFPFFSFGQGKTLEYGLCHLYYTRPFETNLVENFKVNWARNDFLWEKIESKKDEWDFTHYDQMVERIKKNGKKILGILNYDTPWLHRSGKSEKKVSRENIPYFLKYVEKTVRRYKGKVDAWEIWNEPNNPFITKSKEEDFFELAKRTADLIKAIDPKIFVVSGNIWLANEHYLEKMFKFGALEKADAISYHPYSVSSKLLPGRIQKMQSVMNKYNFKGEVWITEFGFPTHGIYFHKKLDNGRGPEEVIKSLTHFAVSKIDKVFWYTLFDNFNPGEGSLFSSEPYFGLAYPNGQFKDMGRAFSQFRRLVGEKKYDPSLINFALRDKNLKAFAFGDESNQKVLVIWRNGIIPKKIKLEGNISNLKSHNIISGEKTEISSEKFQVDKYPQIFTFETPKSSQLRIE